MNLQGEGLHRVFLAASIAQIVVGHVQSPGQIQRIAAADNHLAVSFAQVNQRDTPVRGIHTRGQVPQRKFSNIHPHQFKAGAVCQCNQFLNQ